MKPSLETLMQYENHPFYRRVAVYEELFADSFTPIEVMRTLRAASRHCFLLESAESDKRQSRYTFLGYAPSMEINCTNGRLRVVRGAEQEEKRVSEELTEHPAAFIRRLMAEHKSPRQPGLPQFTGGLVGYFSYEYLQYAEPSLQTVLRDEAGGFCDVDLMLFDRLIVFDYYTQKLLLIAQVDTSRLERSYEEARGVLVEIKRLLTSGAKAHFRPLKLYTEPQAVFSRERYCAMVEKAKAHIREGDIFQIVLSNPIEATASGSLFDTYRVLRSSNPSPYMFYFSSEQIELAGASPETLVKLEGDILKTFPLAGTRPRGRDKAEDMAFERDLLQDEKELAEHNMLVDLGRNDLGKISRIGSVCLEKYMEVLRYSHVMHIGTTVASTIAEGRDALDAIDAVLPAGTLSGAPKIKACSLIRELEGRRRGVYGGAIGYLDFGGNMDCCIAIRLVYKQGDRLCVQSGAGIVADSQPEKEFEECGNKARAVLLALREAEGGLQ